MKKETKKKPRGRPRLFPEGSTPVYTSLGAPELAALEEIAKGKGYKKVNDLVRDLLVRSLAYYRRNGKLPV
jgi:hypothetical protein